MIEEISGLPEGPLGFKISGNVTGSDYDSVLTPAVEKGIEEFDRTRLLADVGPDIVQISCVRCIQISAWQITAWTF